MAVTLATRLRALWLVCLLVFAPAGSASLLLTGHAPGEDVHAATPVHDASDHGIAAGALADHAPDRHCLFCQTASSLRFGWVESPLHLRTPASASVRWTDQHGLVRDSGSRLSLPARAPPARA